MLDSAKSFNKNLNNSDTQAADEAKRLNNFEEKSEISAFELESLIDES